MNKVAVMCAAAGSIDDLADLIESDRDEGNETRKVAALLAADDAPDMTILTLIAALLGEQASEPLRRAAAMCAPHALARLGESRAAPVNEALSWKSDAMMSLFRIAGDYRAMMGAMAVTAPRIAAFLGDRWSELTDEERRIIANAVQPSAEAAKTLVAHIGAAGLMRLDANERHALLAAFDPECAAIISHDPGGAVAKATFSAESAAAALAILTDGDINRLSPLERSALLVAITRDPNVAARSCAPFWEVLAPQERAVIAESVAVRGESAAHFLIHIGGAGATMLDPRLQNNVRDETLIAVMRGELDPSTEEAAMKALWQMLSLQQRMDVIHQLATFPRLAFLTASLSKEWIRVMDAGMRRKIIELYAEAHSETAIAYMWEAAWDAFGADDHAAIAQRIIAEPNSAAWAVTILGNERLRDLPDATRASLIAAAMIPATDDLGREIAAEAAGVAWDEMTDAQRTEALNLICISSVDAAHFARGIRKRWRSVADADRRRLMDAVESDPWHAAEMARAVWHEASTDERRRLRAIALSDASAAAHLATLLWGEDDVFDDDRMRATFARRVIKCDATSVAAALERGAPHKTWMMEWDVGTARRIS